MKTSTTARAIADHFKVSEADVIKAWGQQDPDGSKGLKALKAAFNATSALIGSAGAVQAFAPQIKAVLDAHKPTRGLNGKGVEKMPQMMADLRTGKLDACCDAIKAPIAQQLASFAGPGKNSRERMAAILEAINSKDWDRVEALSKGCDL